MPFHRVYYHVVWATHQRQPLITAEVETQLFEMLRRKSEQLHSQIWALNGTEDHLHIAVSIALSTAVSRWVQEVKGISAYEMNRLFPHLENHFKWQHSYGILTFGAKQLPFVIDYIELQKQHHASTSLIAYLEQMEDED